MKIDDERQQDECNDNFGYLMRQLGRVTPGRKFSRDEMNERHPVSGNSLEVK